MKVLVAAVVMVLMGLSIDTVMETADGTDGAFTRAFDRKVAKAARVAERCVGLLKMADAGMQLSTGH